TVQQHIFVEIAETYIDGSGRSAFVFGLELHYLSSPVIRETVRLKVLARFEILNLGLSGHILAFVHHLEGSGIRPVGNDTRFRSRKYERVRSLDSYGHFNGIGSHVIVRSLELVIAGSRRGKGMYTLFPTFAVRQIYDNRLGGHILTGIRHRKRSDILSVIDNGFLVHLKHETGKRFGLDGDFIGLHSFIGSYEFIRPFLVRRKRMVSYGSAIRYVRYLRCSGH